MKWNKAAANAMVTYRARLALGYAEEPRRPRVFCASLADWLDDEVPVEWLADLLQLIADTPELDWLLLTKRPESWEARIMECMHASRLAVDWINGKAPANVWIGTTVEDQERADERIPALLKIPARVRFLSCEPLLGPVDFSRGGCAAWMGMIDWVICGGESGPKARPADLDWFRSLRDQCKAAEVAFFMKQLGGTRSHHGDLSDFPEDLRVREFPGGKEGA